MSNFRSAFNEGMKHAEEASKNNKEIDEVLTMLEDEMLELSENKIALKIKEKIEPVDASNPAAIVASFAAFGRNQGRRYDALIAVRQRSTSKMEEELCEWKRGEKGYPVTLTYSSRSESCADKSALIKALQKMLSSASTGKKLMWLLNQ